MLISHIDFREQKKKNKLRKICSFQVERFEESAGNA